jgi:hypothetical protein
MNKYQKIAVILGILVLLLAFGKTITKIGFIAVASLGALFWKFIIIIGATLLIISFLRKATKKK